MMVFRWCAPCAAFLAAPAFAQTTTICTPAGQNVFCRTNTPPVINPYIAAEQQRENYQGYAAAGSALGNVFLAARVRGARRHFRDLLMAGKCQEAQSFAIDKGDLAAAQAVPSLCKAP